MKSGGNIIVWLLFPLALLQCFGSLWLYADYVMEKKAYLQYCENKDKPGMHCEGKCVLSKKMAKLQLPATPTEPTIKIPEWPPFQLVKELCLPSVTINFIAHHTSYMQAYSFLFTAIPFHPPKFI